MNTPRLLGFVSASALVIAIRIGTGVLTASDCDDLNYRWRGSVYFRLGASGFWPAQQLEGLQRIPYGQTSPVSHSGGFGKVLGQVPLSQKECCFRLRKP